MDCAIIRPPAIIRYFLRKSSNISIPKEFDSIKPTLELIKEKKDTIDALIEKSGILTWNGRPRSLTDFITGKGAFTKRSANNTVGYAMAETVIVGLLLLLIYKV